MLPLFFHMNDDTNRMKSGTLFRLAPAIVAVSLLIAGEGRAFAQVAVRRPSADTASATQRRRSTAARRPARSRAGAREATPARLVSDPPRRGWASPSGTSELSTALSSALSSHTRSGQWGAIVVSLTRGDTLFEHNPDAMMQPASTMKMYTTAVALDRFGADHVFRTSAYRDGPITMDGTLQGNLYLRGVGDPSLTGRFWRNQNPMDALAREIAAAGIKRVRGDIVGDATAFDEKLIPDGWKTSYLGAAYAARVSALSLNENIVWVVVRPNGGSASVTLDPATTTIPVESYVRLVPGSAGGKISASRRADGAITVRGTIGARSGPLQYSFVVDNPALFTTGALRAALKQAGVQVEGATRLGPTAPNSSVVAAIGSPPLAQIVGEMDRESINIFAELLFRAAAQAGPGNPIGSAENGLANLRSFLSQKVGASPQSVDVADGSGLSLLDRVTPRSMVDLLGYVHRADWGPVFHASLPVEGESGTLKRRAKGTPARGNLHAKTGTTNTVASLGGYVTAKNGEVLAFSLIYNGADRANAKAAMDGIGSTLAEFVRE
jgi:serine-type D-Ala-D-Ala carboxypeptidase/endopeptidase (penicillin-binding protein 4)